MIKIILVGFRKFELKVLPHASENLNEIVSVTSHLRKNHCDDSVC